MSNQHTAETQEDSPGPALMRILFKSQASFLGQALPAIEHDELMSPLHASWMDLFLVFGGLNTRTTRTGGLTLVTNSIIHLVFQAMESMESGVWDFLRTSTREGTGDLGQEDARWAQDPETLAFLRLVVRSPETIQGYVNGRLHYEQLPIGEDSIIKTGVLVAIGSNPPHSSYDLAVRLMALARALVLRLMYFFTRMSVAPIEQDISAFAAMIVDGDE